MSLEADPVREAAHSVSSMSPNTSHLLTGLTERAEQAKVKILGKRALNTAQLLAI